VLSGHGEGTKVSELRLKPVILGGLIAGTIDIFAAAFISHHTPWVILYYIAGGLLGRAALDGGWSVAVLGLALQWAMSLIIAAPFVFVADRMRILKRHWIIAGVAYGTVVFYVMNHVVVPLSAWHSKPTSNEVRIAEDLLAMWLFGVIIAACARATRA